MFSRTLTASGFAPTLAFFGGLFSSSISYADDVTACETGDPGGGGPSADVVQTGSIFKITVNYNRRDLERSARSSVFNFEGTASSSTSVKDQGADCVKSVFQKPHGSKSVEFVWCAEDHFGILKLKNFTAVNPDFELGCDGE